MAAGKAKTASKNNPDARGDGGKVKMRDGKALKPILIISPEHGRYMGAMVDGGDVVTDGAGKPVAFGDL
jgi:hypothetical protein